MSSTQAVSNQQMYSVGRSRGVCAVSGESIAPGELFMSVLREASEGLERVDVKLNHWERFDRSQSLAFWRSTMPTADAPKKKNILVDDNVLMDLLIRLADISDAEKLAFRFVLALILMRKRLLSYESSRQVEGREVWRMKVRGRDETIDVIDPKPTDEQIAQVETMLSQILSEDA